MLQRLFFLLALVPGTLFAQEELYAALAQEVCNCMEEITTERPRGFARACLLRIARENRAEVEEALGRSLGIDHRKDMAELMGHMTAYLAVDCPFLQTLGSRAETTEYRWSDSRRVKHDSTRVSFPKEPLPDSRTTMLAETPQYWILTATVVKLEKEWLYLMTEEGQQAVLGIPRKTRRRLPYRIGDQKKFTYRLEWRIREGRVVKILME